jgi:putative addiction module component (TIGR02574 family)
MTKNSIKVLEEALELPPIERAELVEKILTSFELPDRKSIDELWANEAEDRIDAFEQGKISSVSVKDVFDKIK